MPHLASLVEENGKKGLNVLAITNESRATVLKFMAQLNAAPQTYPIGIGGGSDGYPASGIPKAFLIGVDGKIAWEGYPQEFDPKILEAELKKVRQTDESRTAKAEKALAYAEALITDKQYLRAELLLDRVAKDYGKLPVAKKASDRKTALEADAAAKKETAAQREIDKTLGGIEVPKEKFKKKDRDAVAKSLDALAKKYATDAPASAALAADWAKIVREDWTVER
jgi:hypothetical protein